MMLGRGGAAWATGLGASRATQPARNSDSSDTLMVLMTQEVGDWSVVTFCGAGGCGVLAVDLSLIERSSTSKTSVALGPIVPRAPFGP